MDGAKSTKNFTSTLHECRHCGNCAHLKIVAEYDMTDTVVVVDLNYDLDNTWRNDDYEKEAEGYNCSVQELPEHHDRFHTQHAGYVYRLLRCPACKDVILQSTYHEGSDGYDEHFDEKILYPSHDRSDVDPANSELPYDIKQVYEEARSIVSQSPRGAAALLRLAVEMLCDHLGATGERFTDKIHWLVKSGCLTEGIQESLDTVRLLGNEAVHPGQILLLENSQTVTMLFSIVNEIAEAVLPQPKTASQIYPKFSDGKLDYIRKRDGTG